MVDEKEIIVIKKNGSKEPFNDNKIIKAVRKSAERVMVTLSDEDEDEIVDNILDIIEGLNLEEIHVKNIHDMVELSLLKFNPEIAECYKSYRNYKVDFAKMVDATYEKDKSIRYIGERDRSNANTDTTMVSTKRSVVYSTFNEQLYRKFFLTPEELQASDEGYLYYHDKGSRRDSYNCCLFDIANVIGGGFWLGNMWYNEPKTLDVFGDVMNDVIMSAASQQYGGFTVCEIDKIIEKYAQKSYDAYLKENKEFINDILENINKYKLLKFTFKFASKSKKLKKLFNVISNKRATKKLKREMEQLCQAYEYKLNTVASSRGDYPFVTFTFGLSTTEFGKMFSKIMLKVRRKGQGEKGKEKPVLFPKLVFLYDDNLHGEGKCNEDVFDEAILCSSKSMYPDYLDLTGENPNEITDSDGTIQIMYKKYGQVISPMGCRSFLSPYYERGGLKPADEDDKPMFVGRFNCGVISLNLPMIYMKAKEENKEFFEVLDYYLNLARNLHKRTLEYLGNMTANINPLAFCEGGLGFHKLKPDDKLESIMKYATVSFGYTALNELQQLHNQTSLVEDGEFAVDVLKYINDKVIEFKNEDQISYGMYGTPAESLCQTQVKQFRKKYGIIKNVSDKEYFTNSFHCHVSEDISPIQKQDLEKRFWKYTEGGRIQYCRYDNDYNIKAIKTVVRRAMKLGFYEGVNLKLNYCADCGHQFMGDIDVCPHCSSKNITTLDRVCGYLGYSRINGDTRLNEGKMCEIKDRKSM